MNESKTGPGAAITRVRKRPVEVEAIQWTGDNADAVFELAGCGNFDVLSEQDRANCNDPEATASVFDKLHSTWVLVYTGQWIIKGIKGEFYPCADDVFRETYEPAVSDGQRLAYEEDAEAEEAARDDFDEDAQRAADLRAHSSGMGGPHPSQVTDDAAGLGEGR